jgi:hypothetical protein
VRRKLLINTLTGVAGLGVSILVGIELHSTVAGLMTGFGIAILRLLVDIRLHLHQPVPIEISFLNGYTRLRESPCELFRRAAVSRLQDTNAYFEALSGGRLAVRTQDEVFDFLKLLFCEISHVREIRMTSYGEIDEWRDWWGRKYLEIHKIANQRGVRMERLFILKSDEEAKLAADIMHMNVAEGVAVKYTLRSKISSGDFNNANNCMLFFNRDGGLIYSLQAVHDGEGRFLSAMIYNDISHIKPLADSYGHIEAMSVRFQG